MTDDTALPNEFDGVVRLFPLPNAVLFPHVMMPLHIFEPRYRQMTADALAGDQLIAMALLKPGWETGYEERPEMYSVACLGRIIADQKLQDGRYNLMLRGLARIRIAKELPSDKLYRTARVELLKDVPTDFPALEESLRIKLTRNIRHWFTAMGLTNEACDGLLKGGLPLDLLCDVVSFVLPLPFEFKQELLEEPSVLQRLFALIDHLQSHKPPAPAPSAALKFPPEFSAN